jgi:hypothetical protein
VERGRRKVGGRDGRSDNRALSPLRNFLGKPPLSITGASGANNCELVKNICNFGESGVNIVRVQWPTNKPVSNSYINSSNASAFWAIFNRFARDFKAPPPYSAAASHFVMTPPPAIFCGQVDLQVLTHKSFE